MSINLTIDTPGKIRAKSIDLGKQSIWLGNDATDEELTLQEFVEIVEELIPQIPKELKLQERIAALQLIDGYNPQRTRFLESYKGVSKTFVEFLKEMKHTVQVKRVMVGAIDFVEFVMYVMTNTDLMHNDPRIGLVERMKN